MVPFLSNIRVIDLTEGMLALAGGVLADHGAEVIKVEPSSGDWARSSPGFHLWNRGKQSVVLDAANDADRQSLRTLVANADVVIHALDPGQAEQLGLEWSALHAANPRLIMCSLSGFGENSPHAALGSHERIVMAKSGRMMGNDRLGGSRYDPTRPIYLAPPFASFGAAMLSVQGIIASLLRLRRTGRGQKVETSLLDGISAATMRLAFERHGDQIIPVAARNEAAKLVIRGIMMCFMTMETKDGRYIQMCSRQKHLFRNWMNAIGLGELYETERWSGLPLGVRSYEDADEWERLVREAMKKRTQAEWMELFRKIDIGADPFLTFDEFLDHPQMVQNDRITVVDDPELGPIKQIGPLVNFELTPADCSRPAPQLGQHQSNLASLLTPRAPAPGIAEEGGPGAMSPFTIVEAASFLAAPLGPALMGELGARVIKIEPLEGDPFRSTGLEFVHIGNGKESIAVDLKSADGQAILERVIRSADAFIHNFRPGVPEKIGLGYERVRELNPDIVYLYGASYGSKGPENHRAAFHATPNALSGGGILQAGRGNSPVNDGYGDPCSGVVAGVALALGLYAREVTGLGQSMETSMLSSVGFVHSENLVKYAGAPPARQLDEQQRGVHALDRLYPCRQGWVMLSALREHEWTGLVDLLGRRDWLDDGRFATTEARQAHDAELTALLEAAFITADAAEWEERGMRARVPIAVADAGTFEEFLVREQKVDSAEHAAFGTYWRLPPRMRMSDSVTAVRAPCALGEHSVALLQEFGFSEGEIAGFLAQGTVKAQGHGSAEADRKKQAQAAG